MTTAEIIERARLRRGKRPGTVETMRLVADLRAGDRVVRGDGSRTISRIKPADDGTTHLICQFVDGTCERYRPDGIVQALELTSTPPAEPCA